MDNPSPWYVGDSQETDASSEVLGILALDFSKSGFRCMSNGELRPPRVRRVSWHRSIFTPCSNKKRLVQKIYHSIASAETLAMNGLKLILSIWNFNGHFVEVNFEMVLAAVHIGKKGGVPLREFPSPPWYLDTSWEAAQHRCGLFEFSPEAAASTQEEGAATSPPA